MGQPMSLEDIEDLEKNLTGKSLLIGGILCTVLCIGIRFYLGFP